MMAVGQIGSGSQIQAGATQQISAALEQIEKAASRAQANAERTGERVSGMAAALRRSRDAVRALTEGVLDAVEQTRTSLTMVTGLETVSRRIDNVIDKIALIAVQTTMLAVSGAVEAARAGESGSGFALVSGDIRGLAQEASASADQVKDTVRSILDQIASVRRSLEHIIESADAEAEKNRLAFAALDRVEEDLAALGAANTVILQNAAAVSGAVAQTASGARVIAAAAEEAQCRSPARPPPRPASRPAVPRISPPRSRKSPLWPMRSAVARSPQPHDPNRRGNVPKNPPPVSHFPGRRGALRAAGRGSVRDHRHAHRLAPAA